MIKVSIIIPVYNVEAFIADCLLSVFRQTYNHLEIIVVDDCTPDCSMQIALEELKSGRNRFEYKVVKHPCNQGLSAARNSGVKVATGDYLYFLDSDDEIAENCMAKLVALAASYSHVDFVVGGMKITGSTYTFPVYSRTYIDNNIEILKDYIYGNWYVMACNKLIGRDYFIRNNLWFATGMLFEDELFSFQLACTARKMACIKDETYIYKVRQSGTITTSRQYSRYEKNIAINRLLFEYIFRNVSGKPISLLGRFVINKTYCCLMSLSNAENLTFEQKKILCGEQLKSYQSMRIYTQNPKGLIRIKKLILSLPVPLMYYFMKGQYKVIGR